VTRTAPLPSYALFAAMLASAGLPIYIHAPKVYADQFGVSLAALGAVLFGLRLIDLVQCRRSCGSRRCWWCCFRPIPS